MNYKERPKILSTGVELYPDGTILLIRCPRCGRENWAPSVAGGICAWCGFDGKTLINSTDNGNKSNESKDKNA